MSDVPIRDAATIIAVRDPASADPKVLMGQRGQSATFMPSKYVFPGGAVDAGDRDIALGRDLPGPCTTALRDESALTPATLAAAAIRELWEETGLRLSTPALWEDAPRGWRGFAMGGHRPDASALRFVFRAVTPPSRPRRFDARFFLADASAISSPLDDFSQAEDELSHLAWVPLSQVRALDLPFITEVVLAEVASRLPDLAPPRTVPFFRNDDEAHLVSRLGGASPLSG